MKRKKFYSVKREDYWWIEERNRWQKNVSRKYISASSRCFTDKAKAFAHGLRLKGKVTIAELTPGKRGWDIITWEKD